MGRVIKHINGNIDQTVNNITKIYKDRELKNDFTYINHGYIDDVPIIEINEHSVKVQVAGYTGWIQNDIVSGNYDIVIIPLNQVKNPSYYTVKNGELRHFISSDVLSDSKIGYEISIGKAPKHLNENQKYYSYDGAYFYNSLNDLLNDKKDGSINRAVNDKKIIVII